MITDRPAEVDGRAVPGHREGDLIVGAMNRSAVDTLAERTARFVLLLHLSDGREAEKVNDTMYTALTGLPDQLQRSITWDQGKEISSHERFTIDSGIQIYDCDPHNPWQRGANGKTNGLLHRYISKGADLSLHGAEELSLIADSLNDRPHKALEPKHDTSRETL